MMQYSDDVLLTQSVYKRCHSTPLHNLDTILFIQQPYIFLIFQFFLYLVAFFFCMSMGAAVKVYTSMQIQYAVAIGEVDSEARNHHTPRVALGTGMCRLDSVQMESEFREKR